MIVVTDVGEYQMPTDIERRHKAVRVRKYDRQPDRRFKEGRALHEWFWSFQREKIKEYMRGKI